jgi:hypothetical protein
LFIEKHVCFLEFSSKKFGYPEGVSYIYRVNEKKVMSIFLAILEYIGIVAILFGSIGIVQGLINQIKDESYDIGVPVILTSIGIGLVYFS